MLFSFRNNVYFFYAFDRSFFISEQEIVTYNEITLIRITKIHEQKSTQTKNNNKINDRHCQRDGLYLFERLILKTKRATKIKILHYIIKMKQNSKQYSFEEYSRSPQITVSTNTTYIDHTISTEPYRHKKLDNDVLFTCSIEIMHP